MVDFIVATFIVNGVKVTGLSPTVDIFKMEDDSQVVTGGSMSEVSAGLYKFPIIGLSVTDHFSGFIDGGVTLPTAERFREFVFSLFMDSRMEDVHDEALGGYEVIVGTDKLEIRRKDGSLLKKFDITRATVQVPGYLKRVPEP